MNGYDLTRQWFDFAFEKPECKVQHTAIYCWIVELNNRMGWKEQFGLPSQATIEGLSIGDKRTYLNALRDIAEWGFIEIVQEAKNQFQSCIIKICHSEITPAPTTALDTALLRQNSDTTHSRTPIDKPLNKETKKPINIDFEVFYEAYGKKVDKDKASKKWHTLSDEERELALADAPKYRATITDSQFQKSPLVYLNGKNWLDERLPVKKLNGDERVEKKYRMEKI